MAKNNEKQFDSIRVVGGLLSSQVLREARKLNLTGQSPEDYGIEKGLKFNDELGRYWRIAQSRWKEYREQVERSDVNQRTLAVDDWLVPLLEKVFGYRIEASANKMMGERVFPLTHTASNGHLALVLCGADQELEKGATAYGQDGHKRSPSGLLQEYLNAESLCLWGVVSNGLSLRLLRDNPAMTRPAYLEVDFACLFDEDNYADFASLWLLLHSSRIEPRDDCVEGCWLEQWRNKGLDDGERALDSLRYGVVDALRILGTGFVSHRGNSDLRQAISTGQLSTDAYFQQVLRLVYRFLFLLTSEDRQIALLPGAEYLSARKLYAAGYSLSQLRERARLRRHYDHHADVWQQLQITFAGFSAGQPALAQPALGGLFAPDQCPDIDAASLENRYLYEALFNLSFFDYNKTLSRVNYRDMDTEEFGSVYESLLELIPQLHTEGQWRFSFLGDSEEEAAAGGHARKLTGSYYTPDSLVQELVQSALVPVIEERLKNNRENPREALLSISVCDPACGSGHFLLAASRKLATELARIDAGLDQPSETDYRHALREVVRHCIYGVDINPMAVELCKTGLWLESIEPGKPLGFLDHHIRCGNSLIGICDPKLLVTGIPGDAYRVLSGDDNDVCGRLKRSNPDIGASIQGSLFSGASLLEEQSSLHHLDELPEESLDDIEVKKEVWRKAQEEDVERRKQRLRAHLFVAAFFVSKTQDSEDYVPTNEDLNRLSCNLMSREMVAELACRLAEEHRFFHWYIAYPDVHARGGFDCVLGNPPWDVVKKEDGDRYSEAEHDKIKNWYASGKYEIVKGKKDLYKLFLILASKLVKENGKVGFVVPIGVFVEDKTFQIRKLMVDNFGVDVLNIYQNAGKKYFKSVHSSYIFSTLVFSKQRPGYIQYSTIAKYGELEKRSFFAGAVDKLLGRDLSLPLFYSAEPAEIYIKIVESLSKFEQCSYRVTAEFHASSDKKDIFKARVNPDDFVVLKNDGIQQFNHKYGPPVGYVSSSKVFDKLETKGLSVEMFLNENFQRLVFRDIARADDSRTMIACLLPQGYVSTYDIPIFLPKDNFDEVASGFYLGYFNSLIFDFLVRPHVDKHIKGYIISRLPVPKFDNSNVIMELISCNATNLNQSNSSNYDNLRAEIDAAVLILSGVDLEGFHTVMKSFVSLKRSRSYVDCVDDYSLLVESHFNRLISDRSYNKN